MKLIKTYGSGGNANYVEYIPTTSPQDTEFGIAAEERDSGSSSGKLTEKQFFTMLNQLKGLPNEVQNITSNIQALLQRKNLFEQLGMSDLSGANDLASMYVSILGQIRIAEFNNQKYTDAYKQAVESGGLNEIAITDQGNVMVIDKKTNQLVEITPEEYLSNKNAYSKITNSNLLYLRAHSDAKDQNGNSLFINANGYLDTVGNSVGLKTITATINNIISNLGSTSDTTTGYISIENGNILKGLELLKKMQKEGVDVSGLSVDGMYKAKLITKDQANQINMTLNYLTQMLPQNQMTLLKVNSGNASDPEKGAKGLLLQLLLSKQDLTTEGDFTLEKELNPDGTKKSDDKDKTSMSPVQAWLTDHGVKQKIVIQNGTADGIMVETNSLPITSESGQLLGQTTLNNVMNSQFGGNLDWRSISFGSNVIDPAEVSKVVITDGTIYKMLLPVDQEQLAKDGRLKPDLKSIALVEKANERVQQLKAQGKATPEAINKVYADLNLPQLYRPDGQFNIQDYAYFGAIHGYAHSSAFEDDFDLDTSTMQEVKNEKKNDDIYRIMTGQHENGKASGFDHKGWLDNLFGKYDRMFKGIIYVPVQNSIITAMLSSGTKPSRTDMAELEALEQQNQRLQTFKPSGQLNLDL